MEAKEILTETPEQMEELVRRFRKLSSGCEYGCAVKMGVAKTHTVTKCSHKGYDHYMGPNSLCLFDFCPIIQEELLEGGITPC